MQRRIFAILYAALSLICCNAAADSTPTDFEGWLLIQTYLSLDAEKRYQILLETQPRVGDNWQRLATVQNRFGLNYNINSSWSTMAGYAWTPNFYYADYHRTFIDENRFWQQLAYRHDLFGVQWVHRVRQEQRFIVGVSEVSHRSRYQLRGSYALSNDRSFGLTAFDELMVTLNSASPAPWSGYDRNRIFLGPYWVVAGHRFEVGYLGEHQKRFGSDERWVNAVVVQATFNLSTPLTTESSSHPK